MVQHLIANLQAGVSKQFEEWSMKKNPDIYAVKKRLLLFSSL